MAKATNKPLPTSQMARSLRVKVSWLRAEAEAGNIPALKAGDTFLFDAPTVEKVLRDRAARGDGGQK